MDKLQWKLKPIHTSTYTKTKLYDKIMIYDMKGYPLAMVFVDDFDFPLNQTIHKLLNDGKEITVSLEIVSG